MENFLWNQCAYPSARIGSRSTTNGSGKSAAYNGSKALVDTFSFALRAELKDSGVTVTCVMPGATETDFFERADMLNTEVGQGKKMTPRM